MAYRITQRRLGKGGFAAPVYGATGSDDLLVNRGRLLDRPRGGGIPHPNRRPIAWKPMRPLSDEQQPQIETLGGLEMVSTENTPTVIEPRRRPANSREELLRLRAEQSAMEGLTRTDKKGRVLTGIDAVEDENGRLKSGLNAGLSGLTGVGEAAGQRGYGWAQLAAELARAGGMLLGGVLNKKHDEKAKYQRSLASNQAAQGELMKKIEQENKIVKGDRDIEQTEIETLSKQAAPLLKIGSDMNNLKPIAAIASQILGIPIPGIDYRPVEDTERMGVVSSRRKGEVDWAPNESTFIDPSKVIRDRNLGGQTYRVPDTAALPAAVGIEQANANRSIQVARADADAAGDDADAETRYKTDVAQYSGQQREIGGQIDAQRNTISLATQDNVNLEKQIASLDPKEDKAEIQAIRSQIRQNNERANAAQSEIIKLEGKLKGLAAPVKPKPKPRIGTGTKVNSRRKGSYTTDDIQRLIQN